ncbi:MAG: hypothetical protein R3F61_06495 [Myxococcota bacterium]
MSSWKLVPALLLLACASSAPEPVPPPAPEGPETVGPPDAAWVDREVAASTERVSKEAGGPLLLQAIDAHGGLRPWLAAGTLSFDFDYAPVDAPEKRRFTRSRVDLRSRRAVQDELGVGADATFGWDGTEAWIVPDATAFPSDPRFWATTPFYFVGIPWVLADPGAHVARIDDTVIPETGVEGPLPSLKVTYGEGVGDAPDDYYILHLDPASHRVLAVRYVVSYPGFFPEGGHSPEKILLWSGHTEVDGLLFATHYDSHPFTDAGVGALSTTVAVGNVVTGRTIPVSAFSRP